MVVQFPFLFLSVPYFTIDFTAGNIIAHVTQLIVQVSILDYVIFIIIIVTCINKYIYLFALLEKIIFMMTTEMYK